jgi:hypothetical protein
MNAVSKHTLAKKRGVDIVKIADDKSAYFPDGSLVVRTERLPWTPFNLVGSAEGPVFKLLSVDWNHDMYTMLMIVPGGMEVGKHYHVGEAHGLIMTGSFEYEYGNIFANDYMAEGLDIEHGAIIGKEDVLQFSIIFGGLCGAAPDGGPDLSTFIGCEGVYNAAKANGAADHIAPPPPGWRSPVYARFGL